MDSSGYIYIYIYVTKRILKKLSTRGGHGRSLREGSWEELGGGKREGNDVILFQLETLKQNGLLNSPYNLIHDL